MGMLVVRQMAMRVGMRLAWRRQLLRGMRVGSLKMSPIIVAAPAFSRGRVSRQQALTVMPARTKQVVVLLALGRLFFRQEAIPFTMGMLDQPLGDGRQRDRAQTGGLEEEAPVNIREAVEAKLLVEKADLLQQFAAAGQQIAFNGVDIWSRRLVEIAQVG